VVGTLVRGLIVGYVAVGLVATVPSPPTSPPSTVPTKATHPRTHHVSADLSGKWRLTIEMEVGRATPLLELVQKDAKLTGTYTGRYGASPVEGAVDGTKVSFTVALQSTSLSFSGEIKEDGTLAGKATFGELGDVTWSAAREK
jgi:hypothetical protein